MGVSRILLWIKTYIKPFIFEKNILKIEKIVNTSSIFEKFFLNTFVCL